ncbi:MAG: CAP domain-containing protein [Actinobacteria bacterium]|nr:MAG: CAP domain-containing protein [Actinomycetota bacterium]
MGILFPDRVMGLAQSLTAIVLGLAAPAATVPQSTDASALQAVASSCSGATTPTGGVPAMFCGVNVVRHSYGLRALRGNGTLNRSSLLKAGAIRRCGFTHTPCGMSFTRTFQSAGYLPARAFGENLAWGQAGLGSPVNTLGMWLNSPGHRANLLSRTWRDVGIATLQGQMFGHDGVTLWVAQFGRRR